MILNIYIFLFILLTQLDRKLQAKNVKRQNTNNRREQNILYNKYIKRSPVDITCPSSLIPNQNDIQREKQVFFASYCTNCTTPYKLGVHKLRIDILENRFSNNNFDKKQKKLLFLFHISNYNKSVMSSNNTESLTKFASNTRMKFMYPEIFPNNTSFKKKKEIFVHKNSTPEFVRKLQSTNMKKYIDFTTNPCKDFYQFACGNWVKYNPISRDKSGYDTFEMLRENIDKLIRDLLRNNKKLKDNSCACKKNCRNQLRKIGPYQYKKTNKNIYKVVLKSISLKTDIVSKHMLQQLKNFKYKFKRSLISKTNKKSRMIKTISAEMKAKLLFQSCMNVKVLNEKGISPLLEFLKNFGGWPVLDDSWSEENFHWLNLTALLRLYNNDIFILEWVGPDLKNSDVNIIQLDQASLGLPSRDFYLNKSNSLYVNAYKRFMIEIMNILGSNNENSEKTAEALIIFETDIANITEATDKRIDFSTIYNRMSISRLCEEIPEIKWNYFLSIVQGRIVNSNEIVVVYAVEYFKRLSKLIKKTKAKLIANYILWRFVRHRINNLDDRFKESKQRFFRTLFGREQNPPRWKNCVAQVNSNMGMAVGAMFVRKHFDENSKADTLKMTLHLQQAFLDILNGTTWLDESTKMLAKHKVKSMSWKIGYPDFILSQIILDEKYETLEIKVNQYFENTLNVLKYLTNTENSKLKMNVDKTLWEIPPAVVNAYYSRNKNQMIFPAGILQPPFYHRYFPRSLNYGGIGVVIGHELTHGFDDKGRLFDSNGNVHKWWSDNPIYEFHKRAKCLISQYGNYTVTEDGIVIDGEKTQGENIADNGGIKQAFHAYETWLKKNINSNDVNEIFTNLNFTSKQLFFINFAQIWCGSIRSEALRSRLKTAVHSPGKFRVIGSLSNLREFSQEFHCPMGSPMNPIVKCSVW